VHFSAGIDLNFVDLQHNDLVAYRVMADAQGLPFPAASFDLLAMQWVVEHLAHPRSVFAELARVLRPSGHIVVLTTNACNYVPIISRLTPERLHRAVIERLLHRPSHETFPTFYRANTRRHLRRLAQQTGLQLEACIYVGNPFYLTSSLQLFRMGLLFEKVTDHPALRPLKLYMIATLRKEAERAEGGGG
jgi:SAM-dependent methyltransferase